MKKSDNDKLNDENQRKKESDQKSKRDEDQIQEMSIDAGVPDIENYASESDDMGEEVEIDDAAGKFRKIEKGLVYILVTESIKFLQVNLMKL